MPSSIAIQTNPATRAAYGHRQLAKAAAGSSSSSYSSSPSSPEQSGKSNSHSAQKQVIHQRRPSLLSSALLKEECTVINVGEPDGPPRLISYLDSSQGFAWNPEIFLPSYVDYEYVPLENRREPVINIVLSDEEIKSMLPQ